ncbi:hypothetical protein C5167_029315 [Papaver somniferum]|nr:hypothetical protein C5167_029315 [Papaver somniferum]
MVKVRDFCGGFGYQCGWERPKDWYVIIFLGFQQDLELLLPAVGGLALGGGLELAMGCHARIATPRVFILSSPLLLPLYGISLAAIGF